MINILDELKTDFLVYAQEVNQNRSFPDVRDGLKPSQRAALYTMFRKGCSSNKPHVKSAKITGAIIGELWPHGDSSAYESIVRMSQPWINNIPEVDWHGANGSIQGGPEAASARYTECRLSKVAEDGFFGNIKKDVVNMIPNFSDDDEWPSVFPAIFPRLIVNGSQGIGYTVAQEWEPTNLNEFTAKVIEYIKTKKVSFDSIYPDYPSGGVIVNKSELKSIYETGKGSVVLRGKVSCDNNLIKITELPYQVYAEAFIQKVKDLVNNESLKGIEDICNKSDEAGLLIEIECSAPTDVVLSQLYKQTDLQVTFSANQVALVNSKPELLNLKDYIEYYINHNLECIVREYTYDLHKAEQRFEIVSGLLKALEDIDNIITVIKKSASSEAAKDNLIKTFGFTDNQAKAIVDMRLGKLANLEKLELEKEADTLTKTINMCKKLLESKTAQNKEFMKRIEQFTADYGFARRSEVIDIDLAAEAKQAVKLNKAVSEKFIVVLTKLGYIKRIKQVEYKTHKDIINAVTVDAKDRVVLISKSGTMYKVQADKIPLCTNNASGATIDSIINDTAIALYSGYEEDKYLFFVTKAGLVKKIEALEVFELKKLIGAPVMKVNSDDEIIYVTLVNEENKKIEVKLGAKDKTINTKDFIPKGRTAGGVRAVNLTKTIKEITLK